MLLPVIMAGGTGSRLWPMSRELYPKQFLRLYGQNSMLQETITRLSGLEIHEPMVICNEEHRLRILTDREPVHLYSDWRRAQPGKPGPHSAGSAGDPVGVVPRRGRHYSY